MPPARSTITNAIPNAVTDNNYHVLKLVRGLCSNTGPTGSRTWLDTMSGIKGDSDVDDFHWTIFYCAWTKADICMERKLTGDWAKADFEQTQGRVLRPCMWYGPS